MKRVIIVILFLVLLVGVGHYFWQNREDYLFQGDENFEVGNEVDENAERILQQEGELEADKDGGLDGDEDENEDDEDEFENGVSDYDAPVISVENCNNKCEGFSGNELDYCNEICGFSEDDPNRKSDNCEDLSKLERDACWKQKAVNEKNASVCKNISDPDLQENCENRVLEEVLDE